MRTYLVFILAIGFSSSSAHAGAKDMAKQVAMMAGTAVVINAVAGKQFAKMCGSPGGQVFCPMAAMSFLQAGSSGASGASAAGVAQGFDYGGFSDMSPINIGDHTYTPEEVQGLALESKKQLAELEKKGYKANANGSVKMPNGKTLSGDTISSGAAMASEGLLPPENIEEYDKALAEMKNKISIVSMPSAGGGGGGGSSRSPSSYDFNSDYAMNFGFGGAAKPEAAKTQGLSKNFGDSPIGTSTDDIFDMLHRNYRKKADQSQFVQ